MLLLAGLVDDKGIFYIKQTYFFRLLFCPVVQILAF